MGSRAFALVFLFATATAARADALPNAEIPGLSALKCLYRILEPKKEVQSIDVYVVDDFRSAIEFSFRDKDGNKLFADILFTVTDDTTFEEPLVHHETDKIEGEELDFVAPIFDELEKRCHIQGAGDLMIPSRPRRSQWRWIDLSKEP